MLPYVLFGASYAFAAAAQPGQFQAYLISRAVSNGWRATLPAVVAPILSDVPVVTLVLLVLTRVPSLFVHLLRLAGGLFLLYLAISAFYSYRHYAQAGAPPPGSAQRTILEAAAVNVLNPNPYLSWALVLGPLLIEAWRRSPAAGLAFVLAFYLTMVAASALIVMLFALTRSLGPRVGRFLVGLSAAALAVFGLYQIWAGLTAIV